MAELDLILFDDDAAQSWYPFSLTRPAGEMLLGTMTLRERLEAVTGAACAGYLTSSALAGFDEPDAPHVLENVRGDNPRLLLSSRCVLHFDVEMDLSASATFHVADQIAGWLLAPGEALPDAAELRKPTKSRGQDITLGGTMIEHVWNLVHHNADHIASDILHMHPSTEPGVRPEGAHIIGDYPLVCGDQVNIEPGVVFDLTAGPVWLDDGVTVRAFSRIAGPMYVGKDATLFGGSYTGSTIGPVCKVRGEIEESVILGYSNKAHDGFLGHAYVGKWVNLGAMTTNSDLKNNYSTVRIETPSGVVDTGEMKLGSLIGDHVKTAIGTMLNTGAVIGPGANVFGGASSKHVAPFAWGDGRYDLDRFLATAEMAMGRRDIPLSKSQRDMLARCWQSNGAQK